MGLVDAYREFRFTCIDAGLDLVRDVVREATVGRCHPGVYEERSGPVDPRSVYEVEIPPRSQVGDRVMLFRSALAPDWTTMFNNSQDGWPTLGNRLSRQVRCRVYGFDVAGPDVEHPFYGFRRVEPGGVERRGVHLIADVRGADRRRWEFWENGEPLREEDAARYRDRRVSRRLSREYVLSLARALGFPVEDDRYWTSDEPAAYFVQPKAPKILPDVDQRFTYDPEA